MAQDPVDPEAPRAGGALVAEAIGPIRSVGVCLKPDQPQMAETVRDLVKWLQGREIEVLVDRACAELADATPLERSALAERADLVVALGGDGTLLGLARAVGTRRVPILGVNLGTLGFLAEFNVDELIPAIERVLAGELRLEQRTRLEAVVEREGVEIGRHLALNDAVIAKSALARMIDVETYADGLWVANYRADGLIVSTPTGSTAYNLSAGGPILLPMIDAFVVSPICPHSLNFRPIVMPADTKLEAAVHTRGGEVSMTVDGQEWIDLRDGDRVRVHSSPHPVVLVSSPYHDRFEIMRDKLSWGGG